MTKNLYPYYNKDHLEDIAEYLIETKNYDKLSVLSSSHKFNSYIAINKAIMHLDLKAISTILKYTSFDDLDEKKIQLKFCLRFILRTNFIDDLYHEDEKINELTKYIFKTLLEHKVPLDKTLSTYYENGKKTEINIMARLSAIDIKELVDEFSLTDTDLEYLKNFSSILKDSNVNLLYSKETCSYNQFGAILSRTYSSIINQEQAYQLYKSVYDSGKYGKAIIDYLNRKIVNGDAITLHFSNSGKSSYDRLQNKIQVVLNNGYMSTEAITAHEISHYIINRLFKNDSKPFNFNYYEVDFKKLGFNILPYKMQNYYLNKTDSNKQFKFASNIEKILASTNKYSETIKPILLKSAELLNITIPDQYQELFSLELRDFLKYQSLLPLFILNPDKLIENIISEENSDIENFYNNLIENLNQYFSKSKNYSEDFNNDIVKIEENFSTNSSYPVLEKIKKVLIDKYYPKIIEDLKLTDAQIFFLERAADLVNRDDSDFDEEPVVRCVELELQSKFSDISQDLLDSCKKMNEFWDEEILPLMEA